MRVNDSDFFEETRCIAASDSDLAHVRNIKETAAGSTMQVLLEATEGVLDGHVVTGEVDHLCSHLLLMECP